MVTKQPSRNAQTLTHAFWRCLNEGKIVRTHVVQIPGHAEGPPSVAANLRMNFDGSDRTWSLHLDGLEVARGTGVMPSCSEAYDMAHGPF